MRGLKEAGPVTTRETPWLIVVTGWTGAGKSTIADGLATEFGATETCRS